MKGFEVLPANAVLEFKELFKKETGKDLSLEKATFLAEKVFSFYQAIVKPIPDICFKGGEIDANKTESQKTCGSKTDCVGHLPSNAKSNC